MKNVRKILGKKGRITIPYDMRMIGGFAPNDVLTFSMPNDSTVVIHKEIICDGCGFNDIDDTDDEYEDTTELIEDLFEGLDSDDKFAVLSKLTETYGSTKTRYGGGLIYGTDFTRKR